MGAAKGFKGPYGGWEVANDNDLMSLSNDYRHGVNFRALGPYYDNAYFLKIKKVLFVSTSTYSKVAM